MLCLTSKKAVSSIPQSSCEFVLSYLTARLDILGGGDHAEGLVEVDGGEYHALALDAHHLTGNEVGDEQDALANQLLRVLVELGNAGADGAVGA